MKNFIVASVALAALAGSVHADQVMVDITSWQATAGYLNPGNTSTTVSIPVGSQITGITYTDLAFTAQGLSWLSEFILSVNDGQFGDFWDFRVSSTNAPGVFGPASGAFVPGPPAGGPFTTTQDLFVTVYETFDDTGIDAVVSGGTLTITYVIPTPGAMALLGLGGLVATRRRRA